MKKNILYLIIIATLINVTAVGTMLYQRGKIDAQDSPGTRAYRFEEVKRELSLTPAQADRFEEIRTDFHSRLDSLDGVLEGLNSQLLQEVWLAKPGGAAIDSLLDQIGRLQMESQYLVIRHFNQFKEVLTQEQWEKFYDFVAERFFERFRDAVPKCQSPMEKG